MPAVEVRVISGTDLTTTLAVLPSAYAVLWADERFGTGTGEFSIASTAPALFAGLLDAGNIVQVRVDGTPAYEWEIIRRQRRRGDTWDPIMVSGLGSIILTQSALVYPSGGLGGPTVDERVFGWMSADFDDLLWLAGDSLHSYGTVADPTPPNFVGFPEGFPDQEAEWLWTSAPTVTGTGALQNPAGTTLFRRRLVIPAGAGGRVRLAWSCANSGIVYFDGSQLGSHDDYRTFQEIDLELIDSTEHVIAFAITNQEIPAGFEGQNIGALVFSIIRVNDDDSLGSPVFRSYTPSVGGTGAPKEMTGLDYPDPIPGVTPGFIVGRLFDEAQARGWYTGLITRDFDDDDDSNGQPWATEIEFACQVGDDSIFSVLDRLRDLGVDSRMAPGFTLQLGSPLGTDRSATVTVPLSEANELSTETEDDLIDMVLLRSQVDWREVPLFPVSPRREVFLSLGLTPTGRAADAIAFEVLTSFQESRQVVRWSLRSSQPTAMTPATFTAFDLITAPWVDPSDVEEPWSLAVMRVDTASYRIDEAGHLVLTVETSFEQAVA